MSLENLSLESVFIVFAGFLVGMLPAFAMVGFYFGRRSEKERKALQLKYERQLTALRATVRRLLERIELLTAERNNLKRSNKALREAVRDQHEITDRSSDDLELTQQNLARMQNRVYELEAQTMRYEGRLEQARIEQERREAQFQQTLEHFTQTRRMQRNIVFAAAKLRETQVANQALEERLRRELKPVPEAQQALPPEQQDVTVIEGMEPLYAERLHESGIHTIGDLARQTPARVAHFAGLTSWDDSAAWIAEAKLRLAAPDRPQA